MEEKVATYSYPAPVKGHHKEINIGEFDVVDGIAYPAIGGAGTVVWVTEKPIEPQGQRAKVTGRKAGASTRPRPSRPSRR